MVLFAPKDAVCGVYYKLVHFHFWYIWSEAASQQTLFLSLEMQYVQKPLREQLKPNKLDKQKEKKRKEKEIWNERCQWLRSRHLTQQYNLLTINFIFALRFSRELSVSIPCWCISSVVQFFELISDLEINSISYVQNIIVGCH